MNSSLLFLIAAIVCATIVTIAAASASITTPLWLAPLALVLFMCSFLPPR